MRDSFLFALIYGILERRLAVLAKLKYAAQIVFLETEASTVIFTLSAFWMQKFEGLQPDKPSF